MTPEAFTFFVVLGSSLTLVGVILFAFVVIDKDPRCVSRAGWTVIATLVLAWLWLPWLIYGLTLLPWSQVRKILPPTVRTETLHNPNGGLPQVEP